MLRHTSMLITPWSPICLWLLRHYVDAALRFSPPPFSRQRIRSCHILSLSPYAHTRHTRRIPAVSQRPSPRCRQDILMISHARLRCQRGAVYVFYYATLSLYGLRRALTPLNAADTPCYDASLPLMATSHAMRDYFRLLLSPPRCATLLLRLLLRCCCRRRLLLRRCYARYYTRYAAC